MKSFDSNRYIREMYRTFVFRVDRRKDPEIMRALEEKPNITNYLRSLIYKDLKENGTETKRI